MVFELTPFGMDPGYGESVLPRADVKRHCSIEESETEFDDLLDALRDASVDMVERYCSVYLAPRTDVVWVADSLPSPLRLGVGPVTTLVSATYLDAANEQQDIDVATLRFGLHGELLPVPGQDWPTGISAALTITFDAGFDDDTRPPALVQAARMFTAHLFANRESVVIGTISGEIPLGFRMLCSAYRAMVL